MRGVGALVLFGSLLLTAGAFGAADEEELGKGESYPLFPPSLRPERRCLVSMVSRFDEMYAARKVAMGPQASPLKRAAAEPAIRYTSQSQSHGLDHYLARNRTTGLLVLKGDTILAERYQYARTPEHRMHSYSMAKTVVAMLVGVALAEGKIQSLDDPAAKYVAELKDTPYGETPIRHLLTMSSGVRFSEIYSGADDVATLVRLSVFGESEGGAATVLPFRTRDRAPGERFSYSSAETQVLGLVLRAATGSPVADYLSTRIWQPMGAEADASWIIDKGGYEATYFGVNARVRDWARLGRLLANDGALDGRQIIPAAWVRAATTPPARQFEPGQTGTLLGYGYQTWIVPTKPGQESQFALRGLRGQGVFVDPKSKLVMVHTAAGDVGNPSLMTMLELWFGVVDNLGK